MNLKKKRILILFMRGLPHIEEDLREARPSTLCDCVGIFETGAGQCCLFVALLFFFIKAILKFLRI